MSTATMLAEKPEYRPSEDEEFMNERQLEYFKQKLLNWKEDILRESRETLAHLQTETENHPDLADRATSETDRALELRTRDRQRKLISKIDEALRRIEDGSVLRASCTWFVMKARSTTMWRWLSRSSLVSAIPLR